MRQLLLLYASAAGLLCGAIHSIIALARHSELRAALYTWLHAGVLDESGYLSHAPLLSDDNARTSNESELVLDVRRRRYEFCVGARVTAHLAQRLVRAPATWRRFGYVVFEHVLVDTRRRLRAACTLVGTPAERRAAVNALDATQGARQTLVESMRAFEALGDDDARVRACADRWHEPLTFLHERVEYANVYHQYTEWLAAYKTVRALGREPGVDSELVLFDDAPVTSLDEPWGVLFNADRRPRYFRELITTDAHVCFRRAVLSAPGYHSLTLDAEPPASDLVAAAAHTHTTTAHEFAAHVRRRYRVTERVDDDDDDERCRVTLVVRRPYVGRGTVVRRWANETAVTAALARVHGVRLRVVDLAHESFAAQVHVVGGATDVLVGVHGAALAHVLVMPPDGRHALIEVSAGAARDFENAAAATHVRYERLAGVERGEYMHGDAAMLAARVHAHCSALASIVNDD